MDCIIRDDVIARCLAIRALADKEIEEFKQHTEEYKQRIGIQLSIARAYQRQTEMNDMILWLNEQKAADVRLAKQGHWIKRMEEKVIDGAEIYEPSWFCSECGEEYDPQDCRKINFCFVCGSDLREHHGG